MFAFDVAAFSFFVINDGVVIPVLVLSMSVGTSPLFCAYSHFVARCLST